MATGGMPEMVFEYILKQKGIDIEKDLTINQNIDFGSTAAAFSEGQADFTVEFEPGATTLEKGGKGYVVASLGEDSGYVPYTAFSAKKSYIEKNGNEDVTLSKKQKETIEKIVKRINDLEEKNNSELSGRGEKKSSLNEDLDLITRSDKNIADNLKKIAEKSNQIPKEHLLDYLDRLILNSDTEAISDQLTGEKHETIVENPVLNLSDASEADLNKIYQDIMRQTDNGLREILDNSLEAFLIEDQKVKNFLTD